MTKKEPPVSLEMRFTEALARFARVKPEELAETHAVDVLQARSRAKKQIASARQEIEDGARPRKGRFSL